MDLSMDSQRALAQTISLHDLGTEGQGAGGAVGSSNALHAVKARLQVCVGEIEMTVGELLAAQQHQVLALDQRVGQPVNLLLEGHVVARGQLVALDGHFAFQVTELPAPLKL